MGVVPSAVVALQSWNRCVPHPRCSAVGGIHESDTFAGNAGDGCRATVIEKRRQDVTAIAIGYGESMLW